MESHFGSLLTPLVLDEELRRKLQTIEKLDRNVYDVIPRPEDVVRYMSECLDEEVRTLGVPPGPDDVKSALTGAYDSRVSRIVAMRFSNPRPFPWTIDTITDLNLFLEEGVDSGRLRKGPYLNGTDEEPVPDQLQSYVELSLSNILRILNVAPYEPLIAVSLAWNCMSILKPFTGDGRMTYNNLLLSALQARGYGGITRCPLFKHLDSSKEAIIDGRRRFIDRGDPNPMISSTLDAIIGSYREAYDTLKPLDIKSSVDGVSRSIIRHARGMKSFVLSDARKWLGDISDQTFRARISVLIDMGVLKKMGSTRNLHYIFVDPFEPLYRSNGSVRPYLLDADIAESMNMQSRRFPDRTP